jgi:excisionase family DNA binding protein
VFVSYGGKEVLNADLIHGAPAAAQYTGLPVRTIYHLVEKGNIPVIRKGKKLFFRKSELERAFSSEVE